MTRAFLILLLVGGLWGCQRPQEASAAAAQTAQAQTTEAATGGATGGADLTGPAIPEGYSAVPYLSDEPVREFEEADEVLEPGTDYRAILETSAGIITIDLLEGQTPQTVNNFVFLARHRYYDGVPFHRVLEDFMAQTGDPTGTGTGGPGYEFDNEISPDLSHDEAGIVSMANAGPDTNGSQFFITFQATPWLDGGYSIFGEVVDGLDVLDNLQRIDPQNPSDVAPDTLERVTIIQASN